MKTQVIWDATLCQLMQLLAFWSSLKDCNLPTPLWESKILHL